MNKLIRSLIFMWISSLSLMLIASSASADTWQQIKKSGILTVGIEGTYAPFDFMSAQNKPVGFDLDIVRTIAKKMGLKVHFVKTQWSSLIGGLNADKFDVIVADMTATKERAKSVDFTKPYNATGAVLICRKNDAKYHSLSDLKGAHVGAGAGTTYAKLVQSVPGANVTQYNSFPAYIEDLINGRLDVIVNAKSVAGYVIKKHHYPLKICSGILNSKDLGLIAMAVKKNNTELLKKLNQQISAFVKTEKYKDFYNKWFGSRQPPLLEWMKNHS